METGSVMVMWFDELGLDPDAHPVAMGTHALGERPWLLPDEEEAAELAIKAELLNTHRDQVLYETDASRPAALELARLLGCEIAGSEVHPIEQAARQVQEDLVLMRRGDDGWYLDGSCVCFPTRWHLPEKVGQHIALVHAPVDGYDPRITARVDRLFDQIGDRPVWRRNWFLMTNPTLFQPDRPQQETIIDRADVRDQLFIRSERQTLRKVTEGWVVFTIRIQQATLGELLTTTDREQRLANWVQHVSSELGIRRHLTDPQRHELLAALVSS